MAQPDSVYCSSDCILKHAAATMKFLSAGKEPKAKPKEKAKAKPERLILPKCSVQVSWPRPPPTGAVGAYACSRSSPAGLFVERRGQWHRYGLGPVTSPAVPHPAYWPCLRITSEHAFSFSVPQPRVGCAGEDVGPRHGRLPVRPASQTRWSWSQAHVIWGESACFRSNRHSSST